jgi:hypothetical protein
MGEYRDLPEASLRGAALYSRFGLHMPGSWNSERKGTYMLRRCLRASYLSVGFYTFLFLSLCTVILFVSLPCISVFPC